MRGGMWLSDSLAVCHLLLLLPGGSQQLQATGARLQELTQPLGRPGWRDKGGRGQWAMESVIAKQ